MTFLRIIIGLALAIIFLVFILPLESETDGILPSLPLLILGFLIVIFLFMMPAIPAKIAASRRDTSFLGWYIYGCFFFIIALIHALIMKEDKKHAELRALKKGEMKRCFFCAELIRKEAKVCKFCNNRAI